MKVVCLLSHILGNKTFSNSIEDALKFSGFEYQKIIFEPSDYSNPIYQASIFEKSLGLEPFSIFRKKLAAYDLSSADIVIINCYPLLIAARPFLNNVKIILATDSTPKIMRDMYQGSFIKKILHQIRGIYIDHKLKKSLKKVGSFIPVSKTCMNSLIKDYQQSHKPFFISYCPQINISESLVKREFSSKRKLLFVGNDFARKGGFELLNLFKNSEEFSDRHELVIISNDICLKNITLKNVIIVQGIKEPSEIIKYYLSSEVLILPSKFDQYSFVISEGFAQGLPCITSKVGSIQELMEESRGGIILEKSWNENSIKRAIEQIFKDETNYQYYSNNALNFAKDKLNFEKFANQLALEINT